MNNAAWWLALAVLALSGALLGCSSGEVPGGPSLDPPPEDAGTPGTDSLDDPPEDTSVDNSSRAGVSITCKRAED